MLYSLPVMRKSKISFTDDSPHGQQLCIHSSCATSKGPILSLLQTDTAVGLLGCHMIHTVKQNKYTSSPEQEKIFPNKGICPAQTVGALYMLCKEMFWAHSTFLYNSTGVETEHITTFTNTFSKMNRVILRCRRLALL